MKPAKLLSAAVVIWTLVQIWSQAVFAQGTAFTYQGRLNDGASPANGSYDLRFTVYDAASSGVALANSLTNAATAVSNGLFSVTLDFGAGVFTGPARWLEIGVRTNGAGSFFTLTPRQALTAAPYSITAGTITTPLPATQLSGAIPSANLSGSYSGAVTFNNANDQFNGSYNGNGAGLTNLNASQLKSGTVADARLSGNVALLNGSPDFTSPVSVDGGLRLDDTNLWLRGGTDVNHGLGWYGTSGPIKTFGGFAADGPVLFGYSGGALGTTSTGQKSALNWTPTGVGIGTNNPSSTLHIWSASGQAQPQLRLDQGILNDFARLRFVSGAYPYWDVAVGGSSPNDVMNFYVNGIGNVMSLQTNGTLSAGNFIGSGSGLTSLNASQLASGTVADARLSANVPLLNGSPAFSSQITASGGLRLSDTNIWFRGGADQNHGLGWYGAGKLFAGLNLDGPALFGYSGGALGTINGGQSAALTWNTSGVNIPGNLSANNTPGVSWNQNNNDNLRVTIPSSSSEITVNLGSEGNLKPAPGFFVIMGYVSVIKYDNSDDMECTLQLWDVSGTPVKLTETTAEVADGSFFSNPSLALSWVVPITSPGGYQNFALELKIGGSGGDGYTILSHNLTVMYFPRQNN